MPFSGGVSPRLQAGPIFNRLCCHFPMLCNRWVHWPFLFVGMWGLPDSWISHVESNLYNIGKDVEWWTKDEGNETLLTSNGYRLQVGFVLIALVSIDGFPFPYLRRRQDIALARERWCYSDKLSGWYIRQSLIPLQGHCLVENAVETQPSIDGSHSIITLSGSSFKGRSISWEIWEYLPICQSCHMKNTTTTTTTTCVSIT